MSAEFTKGRRSVQHRGDLAEYHVIAEDGETIGAFGMRADAVLDANAPALLEVIHWTLAHLSNANAISGWDLAEKCVKVMGDVGESSPDVLALCGAAASQIAPPEPVNARLLAALKAVLAEDGHTDPHGYTFQMTQSLAAQVRSAIASAEKGGA